MPTRGVVVLLALALGGCTSMAEREASAEQRGFERGYRHAVQEQYWIIQQQQRRASAANP